MVQPYCLCISLLFLAFELYHLCIWQINIVISNCCQQIMAIALSVNPFGQCLWHQAKEYAVVQIWFQSVKKLDVLRR